MSETYKVTKASVNYRTSEDAKRRCALCSMFLYKSGECTLVRGTIFSNDVCDKWEKRKWK